jgi:DNA-binding CsgD family transcriptional regulator
MLKYDIENLPRITFKGKRLTEKQIAVLEFLAEGKTNTEIAENLFLSVRTVESHISRIRSIISEHMPQSQRISDRQLVLFAKDLIDGFKIFDILKNGMNRDFELSEFKTYQKTVSLSNDRYYMQ